jgi:hypothetical protein
VCTEELKEYCDFVEIEYRQLLSHSKTRWLPLFPGIERLIHMFQALKLYFSSQEHITQTFLPLKVKELLAEKSKEGFARERDKFCAEMKSI